MRRGKKLARILESRIRAWEFLKDKAAFKKPGAKPGNWAKIYGGK